MPEWAVFNDEGCVERGFYGQSDAEAMAAEFRAQGDQHAKAAEMCPDHDYEEQPLYGCEYCSQEDE